MKDKHSIAKTALNNRASRCGKGEKSLDSAETLQRQDSALHYLKFEGSHKEKTKFHFKK